HFLGMADVLDSVIVFSILLYAFEFVVKHHSFVVLVRWLPSHLNHRFPLFDQCASYPVNRHQ
ncbi:hypothetical protein D7Y04_42725, partial [Corallococcus sp. AB038B]